MYCCYRSPVARCWVFPVSGSTFLGPQKEQIKREVRGNLLELPTFSRSWMVGGELLVFSLAHLGGRGELPELPTFPLAKLGGRGRAARAAGVSSYAVGRSGARCRSC